MADELIVTELYDAQQANMDFLVVPAAAFLKQPITSFYVFGFDQNIPKVRRTPVTIPSIMNTIQNLTFERSSGRQGESPYKIMNILMDIFVNFNPSQELFEMMRDQLIKDYVNQLKNPHNILRLVFKMISPKTTKVIQ